MAQVNVNLAGVEPSKGFSPIPKGFYRAVIDESSVEATQRGDGAYLKLRFKICFGEFVNRNIYDNLNIQNQNVQTVNIALAQLAAICKAINFQPPQGAFDSAALHNVPLVIRVKIDKEDQNRITEFLSTAEMQSKYPDEAAALGLGQGAGSTFTPPPVQSAPPAFTPPPAAGMPPSFAPPPINGPAPGINPPPFLGQPGVNNAPPPFAASAPATPPPMAAPAPVAPPVVAELKYWISHPNIQNGDVLLKTQSEVVGLVTSGLFDILVMSEDQSSGWKTAQDFGLVPITQIAGVAPAPAGMPGSPAPWGTMG